MITPFDNDKIDFTALGRLIEYQAKYVDGFVVLGTTGEPYTLGDVEKDAVVQFVLQRKGQKSVIVGVQGNATARCVDNALHWQALGADALLCITPYCNRCNTRGLVAHYAALAQAVSVPIVAYNVPARTGVNITPEVLQQLLTLPHIVGVKEASGNARQIARFATICRARGAGLYCGDDALIPLFRSLGAVGVISAAANAVPAAIADGWRCKYARLPRWNALYLPLLDAMFAEVNPIGVKYACALRGLCRNRLRLPLTPITQIEGLDRYFSLHN